jgi:NADH-quinone oxidoreductase subunit K
MIPHEHVIALAILLFTIGATGALLRRNLVVILMSIELMLNAVNLAFVGFNRMWAARAIANGAEPSLDGQVFALLIVAVAAAEIAVGLAILVALVRNRDSVDIDDVRLLRW